MTVRVRLFAAARDLAGGEIVELSLPAGATVRDARQELGRKYPPLRPLLGSALFAIDADYADNDIPLSDGVELACIPPVSGG